MGKLGGKLGDIINSLGRKVKNKKILTPEEERYEKLNEETRKRQKEKEKQRFEKLKEIMKE